MRLQGKGPPDTARRTLAHPATPGQPAIDTISWSAASQMQTNSVPQTQSVSASSISGSFSDEGSETSSQPAATTISLPAAWQMQANSALQPQSAGASSISSSSSDEGQGTTSQSGSVRATRSVASQMQAKLAQLLQAAEPKENQGSTQAATTTDPVAGTDVSKAVSAGSTAQASTAAASTFFPGARLAESTGRNSLRIHRIRSGIRLGKEHPALCVCQAFSLQQKVYGKKRRLS